MSDLDADRPDRSDPRPGPRDDRGVEEPRDRPGQSPYEAPQLERLIQRAIDIVDRAKPMPLSTSVMINKDEVLDLLEEGLERLPEELRSAKWLLKQREEFLARTRREADEILETARGRAEQMVQRTEVVKAAQARARLTVDEADTEARRLRLEAEDFCDQRLASFEIVLERTMKVVGAGRAKLQGSSQREGPEDGEARAPAEGSRRRLEAVPDAPFFDQDGV